MRLAVFGAAYGEATVVEFGPPDLRRVGVIDCFFVGSKRVETNPIVRYIRNELGLDQA